MHFANNFHLKHSEYSTSLEISSNYLITTGAYKPELLIFDLKSGDIIRTHALQSEVLATFSYIENDKHLYILLRKDNRIEFQDKNGIFYILRPLIEEKIIDCYFEKNDKIFYFATKSTLSSLSLVSGEEKILLRNINDLKNIVQSNNEIYLLTGQGILDLTGQSIFNEMNILRGTDSYLQVSEKTIISFDFSQMKKGEKITFDTEIVNFTSTENTLYVLTADSIFIYKASQLIKTIKVGENIKLLAPCGNSIFLAGDCSEISLLYGNDEFLSEYDLK